MGIIDSISGRDIYFDTNVFIYIFEGFSEYSQILQPVFTAIEKLQNNKYAAGYLIFQDLTPSVVVVLADSYCSRLFAALYISLSLRGPTARTKTKTLFSVTW